MSIVYILNGRFAEYYDGLRLRPKLCEERNDGGPGTGNCGCDK